MGADLEVIPAGSCQVVQQRAALKLAKKVVQHNNMRIVKPHACTCQRHLRTCALDCQEINAPNVSAVIRAHTAPVQMREGGRGAGEQGEEGQAAYGNVSCGQGRNDAHHRGMPAKGPSGRQHAHSASAGHRPETTQWRLSLAA